MNRNQLIDANGAREPTAAFTDWLMSPGASDTTRLAQLALVFDAEGAGLVGPVPGPCQAQLAWWKAGQPQHELSAPWQHSSWLAHLRQHPDALASTHAGRNWLVADIAAAQGQALIWIAKDRGRGFSETETRFLPLAGCALWRRLERDPHAQPLRQAMATAQAQSRLERSARLTGKLAHDFGNLLTGILGFAELALHQAPSGSLVRQYLTEVWQSAKYGAGWVHKLQTFSRRNVASQAGCKLADVLPLEERRLRLQWHSRAQLSVQLAPDLPTIGLEADTLAALLAHLLDNAAEALTDPGIVTLSARQVRLDSAACALLLGQPEPGCFVEITVANSGHALPEQIRCGRFDDFFIEARRRHRGLGLAVVYGSVIGHGGGLLLADSPTGGAVARVYLPVKAAPVKAAGRRVADEAEGARILVVDDDPLVLESICRILAQAGYSAASAPGPQEALELFPDSGRRFELVVSDVLMPLMNGFEMTRLLQERDPAVNVLFMSSQASMPELSLEALSRFSLLRKPFEPQTLLSAVRAALSDAAAAPRA